MEANLERRKKEKDERTIRLENRERRKKGEDELRMKVDLDRSLQNMIREKRKEQQDELWGTFEEARANMLAGRKTP